MNRLAIFHLLALFCISFAPAQADPMKLRKLRGARLLTKTSMEFFDRGDLWLYVSADEETGTINYSVQDGSFELIADFPIRQRDVAVFRDEITVRCTDADIELVSDVDPYFFYKDLFPLPLAFEDSTFSCAPKKVSKGGRYWLDVTSLKGIQLQNGEWIVVALDGDTPRLIFPADYVQSSTADCFTLEVVVSLKSVTAMTIRMVFDDVMEMYGWQVFIKPKISS